MHLASACMQPHMQRYLVQVHPAKHVVRRPRWGSQQQSVRTVQQGPLPAFQLAHAAHDHGHYEAAALGQDHPQEDPLPRLQLVHKILSVQ